MNAADEDFETRLRERLHDAADQAPTFRGVEATPRGADPTARPSPPSRRHRWLAAAAAVLVLAGGGGAWWSTHTDGAPASGQALDGSGDGSSAGRGRPHRVRRHRRGSGGPVVDRRGVPPAIDDLDRRLLQALAEQPRAGVMELARQLEVARGTIQARMEKLQQRGVVTGFGPDVDLRAIGYDVVAFVTLEIAQGQLEDVAAELAALPAVLEAYATTGSSDVLCRLGASSHQDLQDTLLALGRSPTIARSTSVVVLSVVVAPRVQPLLEARPRTGPSRAPRYGRAPAGG